MSMKHKHFVVLALAVLLAFAAACGTAAPKPTPAPTEAPASTPIATAAPTPTEEPAPAADPASFSYVNEDVGLGLTFPQGYTVLSQEDINTLMADSLEQLKAMFKDPAQYEEAIKQSIPVAFIFKHPFPYADGFNANLNLLVQPVSSLYTMDIVSFVKLSVQQAAAQTTNVSYGEVTETKIDGKPAAYVDATQSVNGASVLQRQFYVANNGHVAIFTISADKDDERAELVSVVESAAFLK